MSISPIFWWGLRAAVAVAAVAFAATWPGDRPASPGVVYAATWEGDWVASTGHWVGTIKYSFDDTGDEAWTEAEKTVVREVTQEWEDLPDSNVDFDEVAAGGDVTLRWAEDNDRDGTAFRSSVAGRMTGGVGDNPPTGVDFHTDPSAGWYVDPDPTTDEAIPDGKWDFLSVAKHELGHVLGLKHTFGTVASMDTWSTGDRQRLTESDQEAAANLYLAALPEATPTPGVTVPKALTDEQLSAIAVAFIELFPLTGYELDETRTGVHSNDDWIAESLNVKEAPQFLEQHGRTTGHRTEYLSLSNPVYQIRISLSGFSTPDGAWGYLDNLAPFLEGGIGTSSTHEGMLQVIEPFTPSVALGDGSMGLTLGFSSQGTSYYQTYLAFTEGSLRTSVSLFTTPHPGDDVRSQGEELLVILRPIIVNTLEE